MARPPKTPPAEPAKAAAKPGARKPRAARTPADPHAPITAAERGLLAAVTAGHGRFDARHLKANDKVVRSAFLRALLLGKIKDKAVPETGLATIGLVFDEQLNLSYASRDGAPLPPIRLGDSIFKAGAVFVDTCLARLGLEGSTSEGEVSLQGVVITGDAWLDRLTCTGGLNLMGATIGGQLALDGAKLRGAEGADDTVEGAALSADGAVIKGGVFCNPIGGERFEAAGAVRLLGAEIGAQLCLNGAKLKGAADAGGRVIGTALSADRAMIKGGIFCDPAGGARFEAEGEVRLIGAEINGQLSLQGAKLKGATEADGRVTGDALSAEGAVIRGGIFCNLAGGERFEAEGEVRLIGAEINGELSLKGAKLKGSTDADGRVTGDALSADRAVIRGGIFFTPAGGERFEAEGVVRLPGAEIGGQLVLRGARLSAFVAERVKVAGAAILDRGFACQGGITFAGASLGDVVLQGEFNPASPGDSALNLNDASMRRLKVRDLTGQGKINLEGATAETVDCLDPRRWGAPPGDNGGLELDLDGFVYRRAEVCGDLPEKRARKWARFWVRDPIAENVLDLLDRGFQGDSPQRKHYTPQPFEQAAKALREAGYDRAANEVAVAKREFKRACKADGRLAAFMARLSVTFFRHGYGPLRAAAWTVALVLMGAWAFSAIDEGGGLVIADPVNDRGAIVDTSLPDGGCRLWPRPEASGCAKAAHGLLASGLNAVEQPILWGLDITLGAPVPSRPRATGATAPRSCPEHAVAYSLDTFLPLVDFGIDRRCRVADDYPRRGLAETFRIAFSILGWLFIPMVALTFAGVLRKD